MPDTSKDDNCFREKEEGMILQVWQWGVKTVLLFFHLFVNTYIYNKLVINKNSDNITAVGNIRGNINVINRT